MRNGMRLYALLLALPFLFGTLFCSALIAWDPLDIRPWGGAPPRLAERGYPMLIRPLLAPTMTHRHYSVVLAGTSTAFGARPSQLTRLGDGGPAVNLSQAMQRVPDGDVLFRQAARTPGMRRLVLEVSHIWLMGAEPPVEPGKRLISAYALHWYEIPEFDRDIIRAGINELHGGSLFVPEWAQAVERVAPENSVELNDWQLNAIHSESLSGRLNDFPEGPTPYDCTSFTGLRRSLTDVFATARQRGFQVDVYFSPIPYVSYPLMTKQHRNFADYPQPLFPQLMRMHRCVVGLVAAQRAPAIAVHALDADPAIISDLRGMRDPLHYSMAFKFDRILGDIGTRRMVLTPENFENYRRSLRQGIFSAIGKDLPNWHSPAVPAP